MLKDRFIIYLKWTYLGAILISIFSGFGNMPLYARYYVADIPGLGWSGNFYINLYVHYLSGAVLLAVSTYSILHYMQQRGSSARLTLTGVVRAWVLGLVLISGLVAAIKNLSFVNLSQGGLMVLAFTHLGASMIFIFLSIGCRVLRKPWLTNA